MNIPQYSLRAVNNIDDSSKSFDKVLSLFSYTQSINQTNQTFKLAFHYVPLPPAGGGNGRLKTHVAYEEILK